MDQQYFGVSLEKLLTSGGQTLYMVAWSLIIGTIIGIILALILVLCRKGGLAENRILYNIVSIYINIVRSIPFVILLVAIMPLTRTIVGTTIGSTASLVPLVIYISPYLARLMENSLLEINPGILEAAEAMGATTWQTIRYFLLPETLGSIVLALTTGARQAEIMTLRLGQIDFVRRVITLTKTKNGETRSIPLVGEAFMLLQERSKVRELKDDRVFPPVKEKGDTRSLRTAWEVALKKAEITDFHWHDLRHTAASYLAMSGVSLVEIAKVLGHRTLQMVARYSHLADEHIVTTGEKLAARLGVA